MGIMSWIAAGLLVGLLAGTVMKGKSYGVFGDILMGIIGAILSGFVAGILIGVVKPESVYNPVTLVAAIIGAVLMNATVRALPDRSPV